jgi:hypothetical protein
MKKGDRATASATKITARATSFVFIFILPQVLKVFLISQSNLTKKSRSRQETAFFIDKENFLCRSLRWYYPDQVQRV